MRESPPPRVIPVFPVADARLTPDAQLAFTASPPLALYVHIPWCVRKCPYCDFNSHDLREELPESPYVEALIADLEAALPLIWGRRVGSIFFGGGTPSLLSGAALSRLLDAFRARLTLIPGCEITLEANPGTVEAARFAVFREAGVKRLSLGIQSFDSDHLKALGRIHDGDEARRAVAIAAEHFENFNLDLMYGLPGQTPIQALNDLDAALSFAPPHLSCYQLTLEANTAFAAQPPVLPSADSCADMQDGIETRLAAAGYVHYETSAFARPDSMCRHNLNYWQFGDYLGIGAGAHSKLTVHDRGRWQVRRQMRWKQPKKYLAQVQAGQALQDDFAVAASDLPFEFLMNALRLNQGFDARLFSLRTSLPLTVVEKELREAESRGLLTRAPQVIAPTEQGRRFLNRLLELFLPDR